MSDRSPVVPRLSEQALASLAGARLWARVAGLVVLVPCGLTLLVCLVFDFTARLKIVAVACVAGWVALSYAARLGRFARGDTTQLVAAFRALRVEWIMATVLNGLLLLSALAS